MRLLARFRLVPNRIHSRRHPRSGTLDLRIIAIRWEVVIRLRYGEQHVGANSLRIVELGVSHGWWRVHLEAHAWVLF